ncbi:SGNH/GDSL hydrolase family protein [Clostridium algidicarnis]|uniref:SGNH/GDSL hydrolase family protein n=1 Tax=Clostridium algidicarnis TaxID=37659 RepID=UPI001C0E6F40|nr:SGNH/GDSL hydrolase family protein [Clostridium algidicarnis]MBU3194847.1 SGNH/GDSL hydrolase family protein [Clostridium algidicarnis]
MIKKIKKPKALLFKYFLIICLTFLVLLGLVFSIKTYRSSKKYSVSEINNYIDKVSKTNFLEDYNLVEAKINAIPNKKTRLKLQSELGKYSSEVYTQDVKDALYWFGELNAKKDLWSYEVLRTYLIPHVKLQENRDYLLNELMSIGTTYVFTESVDEAVAAIDKAWLNKDCIKEAEMKIVNNLSYENPWSMAYLEGQLNMVKAKNKEKQQVLIIGDSITLGMGAEYMDGSPKTKVENTWWNNLDQSKYEFSTLAVGGIGVLKSGIMSGLELVKFIESSSTPNNSYDKIIIALSTNDDKYSNKEYKEALRGLVDYVKIKYTGKELIFINFHDMEDAMKEVANSYNATFIDIDMDKIDKCNLKKDNIHPSVKGHSQISDVLKKYF